ncbi:hypothetical protein E2C01_022879 [Portunus trituberculatus]|uniref:Uncharacterized protein n=1 Tax=Portunus trituberculatus TaxID=210409 RepID=A0A5B7E8I0_PORTR|nr:hypothetical protein [Portunus trituberculatus]
MKIPPITNILSSCEILWDGHQVSSHCPTLGTGELEQKLTPPTVLTLRPLLCESSSLTIPCRHRDISTAWGLFTRTHRISSRLIRYSNDNSRLTCWLASRLAHPSLLPLLGLPSLQG